MLRADETEAEPDDLLAAARTAALELSDRLVPTADDAVEKDRLERAPVETVEGNEEAAGDVGAAVPSRLFSPLPFFPLLLKKRKRKQSITWSRRRLRGTQFAVAFRLIFSIASTELKSRRAAGTSDTSSWKSGRSNF
jgi:hypothetical protein